MTNNNALLFKINCHRQLQSIPFNHWFSSKTFLPKIPNPNTPTKLRGITVLSAEASLTAKLDNNKFYDFLTKDVPNNQMGFTPGVGCDFCIYIVLSIIKWANFHSTYLTILETDIQKAYDLVMKNKILTDLNNLNIDDNFWLSLQQIFDNNYTFIWFTTR